MRVLENVPWKYTCRCRGCDSKLEAGPEDCTWGPLPYYDSPRMGLLLICPLCEQVNGIEEYRSSPTVVRLAQERATREGRPVVPPPRPPQSRYDILSNNEGPSRYDLINAEGEDPA